MDVKSIKKKQTKKSLCTLRSISDMESRQMDFQWFIMMKPLGTKPMFFFRKCAKTHVPQCMGQQKFFACGGLSSAPPPTIPVSVAGEFHLISTTKMYSRSG
jgi:hypothetical protein